MIRPGHCHWEPEEAGRSAVGRQIIRTQDRATGVDNQMRIAQEEVFGPVLSVIKFKDEEDAVRIANDIAFGLGAGVWTQSVKRAYNMARRIKVGTIWVNTYRAVSFLMPFGGHKASDLGVKTARKRSRVICSRRVFGSTTDPVAAIPSS